MIVLSRQRVEAILDSLSYIEGLANNGDCPQTIGKALRVNVKDIRRNLDYALRLAEEDGAAAARVLGRGP